MMNQAQRLQSPAWPDALSGNPAADKLRPAPRAGFSLLEILVAMTILAVALMAVVQLFPRALRQARGAAERTDASSLAKSQLASLRAAGVEKGINEWAEQLLRWSFEQTYGADSMYYTYQQAGIPGLEGNVPDFADSALKETETGFVLTENVSGKTYDRWVATIQRMGEASNLYCVTFSVEMPDGRHESFMTYVSRE